MVEDQQDTIVPLGKAIVILQPGGQPRRFRVDSATLKLLPGRRVRLGFEGPTGSVAIEISRATFWHVTSLLHEQSIGADPGTRPPEPKRGKRS